MTELEQVLAGQCIHGHDQQSDCGTCLITRRMAGHLRMMLGAIFGAGSR